VSHLRSDTYTVHGWIPWISFLGTEEAPGCTTSPSWGAMSSAIPAFAPPASAPPASAPPASAAFPSANVPLVKPASIPVPSRAHYLGRSMSLLGMLRTKLASSFIEFTIGALLCISGQQDGNLSCTGLGLGHILSDWYEETDT